MTSANLRCHVDHSSAGIWTASNGGIALTSMVLCLLFGGGKFTAFIHYELMACFQKCTEEVAMTRRKADSDKAGTAAGNTAKLIGELNI